ncbi:MAG: hypothetical protein WA783_19685 [Phormidesmis sp.]
MTTQIKAGIIAAIQQVRGALSSLQLQRFVAVAFVGLFLLTTSVDSSTLDTSTKSMLNDMISRGENDRPVTSAQWGAENKALKGNPIDRAERIVEETADAVGEMAEIYPDTAESTLPGLTNESLETDD